MPDDRKMIEFDARLLGRDPRQYILAPMSAMIHALRAKAAGDPPCSRQPARTGDFPKGLVERARDAQRRFILALYQQDGVADRGQVDMILDVQNVADDASVAYAEWAAFCADAAKELGASAIVVVGKNAPADAPRFIWECDCKHFHAVYEPRPTQVQR